MLYCESIHQTRQFPTREVRVGSVGVGGGNPIRIQSMTTSPTHDVKATGEQILRLADAGCEIARVTVQGMREAHACGEIKNFLTQKGCSIPLVADIHFYPPAAMHVVEFVDKVRVNPGNFVDRRATFRILQYNDASYAEELAKIEEKFAPLIEKCIQYKRAIRIGTNHGSLSDRIMNRYGDTPFGMVESAFEFARVCRKYDFHDLIFSMKASNTLVMVEAYRLLVSEMKKLGWNYPLHLGVTEAGSGEDGRIKSAVGMGALLLDGIGDTIRVSLTEDPWEEMDPCKRLASFAASCEGQGIEPFEELHRTFNAIERRAVDKPLHRDASVVLKVEHLEDLPSLEGVDALIYDGEGFNELGVKAYHSKDVCVVKSRADWEELLEKEPELILFQPERSRLHEGRLFFEWLKAHGLRAPVLLNFVYSGSWDDFLIQASSECGALLVDKLGDGLALEGPFPLAALRDFSLNLLQATRLRTSKTEFISCPGCGRTLFDLQEVSKRIEEKTAHLPGVRIAIMGCIVNGPGEMADADFGYVGSRPGMIDLYVGKKCVERGIPFAEADERLIDLIKAHGRWVDPIQSISLV